MAMNYKYRKQAGALQEATPPRMAQAAPAMAQHRRADDDDDYAESYVHSHATGTFSLSDLRLAADAPVHAQSMDTGVTTRPFPAVNRDRSEPSSHSVEKPQHPVRSSMFFYSIEEGQRVLVIRKNGTMEIVEGPRRIFSYGKRLRTMEHHIAHPGEFLIVRYRDGRQEHQRGPSHLWLDPRDHLAISKEEIFQISDREAIVVYSKDEDSGAVSRRIVHGPEAFMPAPGEWLHTFSWHGSRPGPDGTYQKVPNALVFQKLWLLPDQMYHDVPEVRTADGAVLTIRLMLFFELVDIEKMLATTHDPIGDFVNAATSDAVEFVSKHDFEGFKAGIERLNDIATYKQLTARAEQCGYRISKVVYRGYGAPRALQLMHEQALESRTRLQLEKDTEKQAQELEDLKLERRLLRATKEREERAANQEQDLELAARRQETELAGWRAHREITREEDRLDAESKLVQARARDEARSSWLHAIAALGVDLTAYLTQGTADQIIELRGDGQNPAHIHVAARQPEPPKG